MTGVRVLKLIGYFLLTKMPQRAGEHRCKLSSKKNSHFYKKCWERKITLCPKSPLETALDKSSQGLRGSLYSLITAALIKGFKTNVCFTRKMIYFLFYFSKAFCAKVLGGGGRCGRWGSVSALQGGKRLLSLEVLLDKDKRRPLPCHSHTE